jgi:hypothetical protein
VGFAQVHPVFGGGHASKQKVNGLSNFHARYIVARQLEPSEFQMLSCQREIGRHFASPHHCAPGTLMLTAR